MNSTPYIKKRINDTNVAFESRYDSLKSLLDRTDVIGYVAARNFQSISDAIDPYLGIKDKLIKEFGRFDNTTGRYIVTPNTENFDKFLEKLNDVANLKIDVDVYLLKYSETVGKLSGNDILKFDWMLVD